MSSTIIPTMKYEDAPAAIDWLCQAFGFEQNLVVPDGDGGIAHAQLVFNGGMIMLGSAGNEHFDELQKPPRQVGGVGTQSPYIIIDDVDGHCAIARAAGAEVVMEPQDQSYGGRSYCCRDPGGHIWTFGSYNPWHDD